MPDFPFEMGSKIFQRKPVDARDLGVDQVGLPAGSASKGIPDEVSCSTDEQSVRIAEAGESVRSF